MDKKKAWKEALGAIKVSVSSANFSTWFSQTFIVSCKKIDKGRQLVEVGCPSSFVADAVEKRYFGLVQDALNKVTGLKNDLSFVVQQKKHGLLEKEEAPLFSNHAISKEDKKDALKRARVRLGFTFENFAVSGTNQMAWAAADAVSKSLGEAYNPLFIWGGVGVGKTHLMLAIGERILRRSPQEKVLFCMGEEFTTEIIEAIRTKTTSAFKRRYRNQKLLMIDDIQFLAGKVAVQEEFFHTFNTLQREGAQIVLTSDMPPAEIPRLEDRLRSRFEAGLIIDISPPDFELRTAIALIKARARGVDLPMDAAQAIAANLDGARKIEGFIVRLISCVGGDKTKIDQELVSSLLGKNNGEAVQTRARQPQDFIHSVSTYFSLGKRQLLGSNRAKTVSVPRQILMYLLRIELGLPLQEVGRLVGGRDHTTVMHAVEKISRNLSTDESLREDILRIKRSFSG